MRRFICLILVLVMVSGMVYAADSVTYSLKNGVLTISGQGAMANYSTPPWQGEKDSITSIVVANGVTSLGMHVFYDCPNLTTVSLPDSLTSIGAYNFENCPSLTSYTVGGGNTNYLSVDGVLFSKDKTWLYCFPAGRSGRYTIPAGTEMIEREAFQGASQLVYVSIPDTVHYIGIRAFANSALAVVTIPGSVTQFGINAFDGCPGLAKVVISEGVTSIPDKCFQNCPRLSQVELPDSLSTLCSYVFKGCPELKNLTLPKSLTYLWDNAFSGSGIETVHFTGNAPTLGSGALSDHPIIVHYDPSGEGWYQGWGGLNISPTTYSLSTTATCLEGGRETTTCDICGAAETVTVSAYGHRYGDWQLTQDATPTAEGWWSRFCTVCGAEDRTPIPKAEKVNQIPFNTDNRNKHDYHGYWSSVIKSNLTAEPDGTFTRVEYDKGTLSVERYDTQLRFLDRRSLPMELELFGGYYSGRDYNFIVFGQPNPTESREAEVIRVVRYTKDWKRQGSASGYGLNTKNPFEAGSLRMVQAGDRLFIHTSHTMFRSVVDRLNHQANFMQILDIPTMTLGGGIVGVANISYGYVSHSFNQFVTVDGDDLVTLNHGDSYPRAAVVSVFDKAAKEGKLGANKYATAMTFYGRGGDNDTGALIGDFGISDTAYLVAGLSVKQDGVSRRYNLFLSTIPKAGFGSQQGTVQWLSSFPESSNEEIYNPYLVQVSRNRFLLLWAEETTLKYCFVDGNGKITSQVYATGGQLSDVEPVISNNRVIWYVTDGLMLKFYILNLSDGSLMVSQREDLECFGNYPCPSSRFIDVAPTTDWSHAGIDYVLNRELMNGTGSWTFEPEAPMTRAMVVTVLWRFSGEPKGYVNHFSDVNPYTGSWYIDAVAWAADQGIVNGVGGSRFDPDGNVTREQLAAILYRYADMLGRDTSAGQALTDFADESKVSPWAREALSWTAAMGIVGGSAEGGRLYLMPDGNATRAQVAAMLMRFIKNT